MDDNRRRPRTMRHVDCYTTRIADILLRGTAVQLVAKCEALGYDARRDKDEVLAHRFFQTADHYKRIENNDTNQQ